jgi:LPS O-antigen subunit length determinant protein (WzzB/FepE family)
LSKIANVACEQGVALQPFFRSASTDLDVENDFIEAGQSHNLRKVISFQIATLARLQRVLPQRLNFISANISNVMTCYANSKQQISTRNSKNSKNHPQRSIAV